MAKIKNKVKYPLQNPLNINDYVVGTDYLTGGTKSFTIGELLSQTYGLNEINLQCLLVPIRTTTDCEGNIVNLPYQIVDILQAIINKICDVVVVDLFQLTVNKVVSTATPIINQNFVYTITVTNTGDVDGTNVSLVDLLPSGIVFVQSNSVNYNPVTGLWNIGLLQVSQSVSLNITVTTNSNVTTIGQPIINTITNINADQEGSIIVDNNDIEVVVGISQNLRIDAGYNRARSSKEPRSQLDAITANTNVTFLWEIINGGQGTIQFPDRKNSLIYNLSNIITTCRITMTDNINGNVVTDTVKIIETESPINQTPLINLTAQSTSLSTVTINGDYTDPNGLTNPEFQWTFIETGSTSFQHTIVNENLQNVTITNLLPGIYIFRLTVTNTNGFIGNDAVVITVT